MLEQSKTPGDANWFALPRMSETTKQSFTL